MLRLIKPHYFSTPVYWSDYDISIGAFTVIDASDECPVLIGESVSIGHNVIVSCNVSLGNRVKLDSQTYIGAGTKIGDGSEIHGVKVHRDVSIGSNTFVGGEVSNWTTIGDNVTFMGRIVHTYRKAGTSQDWRYSPPKPSPNICNRCVVGENALLIGGIIVNEGAYIGAGETVKCDVPQDSVFIRGRIWPISKFRGFISSRDVEYED